MFKKNTAVNGFGIGHFINATTGAVVTTGTPTCTRIIDGTGAALTNAAAYDATAAVWKINLAAADLNGDLIVLSFALASCLPVAYTIRTCTGIADANGLFPALLSGTQASDILAIDANVLKIYSDTTLINADTLKIYSDTTAIHTLDIGIYSDTTSIVIKIDSDALLVATKAQLDSEMVIEAAAHVKTQSDIALVNADTTKIYSDTTAIHTLDIGIYSDTTAIVIKIDSDALLVATKAQLDSEMVIEAAAHVKTQSDVALVNADTTKIYSDTVIITSDLVKTPLSNLATAANLALVTTAAKQDSDMAVLAGHHAQITSDMALVYSDTTLINADTVKIYSDTVIITSDLVKTPLSNLATAANLALVTTAAKQDSDMLLVATAINLAAVKTDTTKIVSDLVLTPLSNLATAANLTAVKTETAKIYSDTTLINADTLKIYSDTTAIHTLDIGIYSDTTAIVIKIDSDALLVATKAQLDSEMVIEAAAHVKTQSDIAAIPGGGLTPAQASDLLQIDANVTKVYSDTTLINADTLKIYSDTTLITADTAKIYSDTTIITSDLVKTPISNLATAANLALVTTAAKQDSDMLLLATKAQLDSEMVIEATAHVKTQSDIAAIPAGGLTAAQASDLLQIDANATKIYSDTTALGTSVAAIYSDTTLMVPVLSDVQSDTNKLVSDVTVTPLSNLATAAAVVAVKSELVLVHSETTAIQAMGGGGLTVAQASELLAIQATTVGIYSDTTLMVPVLSDVQSDTNKIVSDLTKTSISNLATAVAVSDVKSELVLVHSETTAIQAVGGGGLTVAQASELLAIQATTVGIYSDTTLMVPVLSDVQSDTNKIVSDMTKTALSDLATATNLAAVKTETAKIYSDTTLIDTATTKIVSDLVKTPVSNLATAAAVVAVKSELVLVHSETTAMQTGGALTAAQASELAAIQAEVTLVHSETTAIQTGVAKVTSDMTKTALSDLATATNLAAVKAQTAVINSDTMAIHSDTTAIHSDTTAIHTVDTAIYSDTTLMVPVLSDVQSDTNKLIIDVAAIDTVVDNTYTAVDSMLDDGVATYDRTTDSLQALRDKLPANLEDMAITNTTGLVSTGDLAAGSITATAVSAGAANAIADALLNRDLSVGSDSGSATVRTVRQALRFLRNKWSVVGTTLTVCKEDDAAASWTATLSTDPAAEPITGSDPASV